MAATVVDPVALALGAAGIAAGASIITTGLNNFFQGRQREADHAHQLKLDRIAADRSLRKEKRQQLNDLYLDVLKLLYGLHDAVQEFLAGPIDRTAAGWKDLVGKISDSTKLFSGRWAEAVNPIRLESLAQPVIGHLEAAKESAMLFLALF